MAYEIPLFKHSFVAGGDLTTSQFKIVKLNSSGEVVVCTAIADKPIGILQNNPASGGMAEVMIAGISKVVGQGDLAKGALVATHTNGNAIVYTPAVTTSCMIGQVLNDNTATGGLATIAFSCFNAISLA